MNFSWLGTLNAQQWSISNSKLCKKLCNSDNDMHIVFLCQCMNFIFFKNMRLWLTTSFCIRNDSNNPYSSAWEETLFEPRVPAVLEGAIFRNSSCVHKMEVRFFATPYQQSLSRLTALLSKSQDNQTEMDSMALVGKSLFAIFYEIDGKQQLFSN